MNVFIEKLTMNGYGNYVWASFILVIGVLLALQVLAHWRLKKALVRAQNLELDNNTKTR